MKYLILKILLFCIGHTTSHFLSSPKSTDELDQTKCPQIYPKKFIGYVPAGNRGAGNFTKVLPDDTDGPMTVNECVQKCCDDDKCNVVFMYKSRDLDCFLVQCDSNEKCSPVYKHDQFTDSLSMVLVRPVTSHSSWRDFLPENTEDLETDYDQLGGSGAVVTPCNSDIGCSQNEYCSLSTHLCECKPGFVRQGQMLHSNNVLERDREREHGSNNVLERDREHGSNNVLERDREREHGSNNVLERDRDILSGMGRKRDRRRWKREEEMLMVGRSNEMDQEAGIVGEVGCVSLMEHLKDVNKYMREHGPESKPNAILNHRRRIEHISPIYSEGEEGTEENNPNSHQTTLNNQPNDSNPSEVTLDNQPTDTEHPLDTQPMQGSPSERVISVIQPLGIQPIGSNQNGGLSSQNNGIISPKSSSQTGFNPSQSNINPLGSSGTELNPQNNAPSVGKLSLNAQNLLSSSQSILNPLSSSQTVLNPSMSNGQKLNEAKKVLTVSVKSKVVKLPENEVQLSSYVVPVEKHDPYQYQWTLLSFPEGGSETTMMDQSSSTLKLSKLIKGVYVFRVNVTSRNGYGYAIGNVTVLPADRINQPPKAIINPSSLTVKLPNTVAVLDGTPSQDDDKIISWRWELEQGPLEYKPPTLLNVALLKLDNLNITGNYTFKLIVQDSNHAINSTTANITVTKVPDYPPEANAGPDIILYLPNTNVTLNGNLSTDDHGLVSYEWTLRESNQHKPVDMQKSKTPQLQLSNLELGTYTFTLKVTDGSNQTSTSDVHVFVKQAPHAAPRADGGGNYTVTLPQTWVVLDAARSQKRSDGVLVNFTWVQRSGPSHLEFVPLANHADFHLNSSSNMKINATHLTKGVYVIELTVRDVNDNSAKDLITIQVLQNGNQAPKANAGDNMVLYLPQTYIILNGSKSSDDLRIVRWVWTRDPASNALGDVIMNSDTQPVMILTNIVIGRYLFKLTVYDDQGLHSEDTVSVIIKPDPLTFALTTLTLNIQASLISSSQASSLLMKINLLVEPNYVVMVRSWTMEPDSKLATLTFLVNGTKGAGLVRSSEVVAMIRDRLRLNRGVLDLDIVDLKTFECQNPCSGHGKCMEESRICLCDSFWMRNLYTAHFTQDPLLIDDNCDWSLLYVILGLLAALSASLLCCVCICYRLSRRKGVNSSHWGGKTLYRNGNGGRAGYKYKTMSSQYSKSRSKYNLLIYYR